MPRALVPLLALGTALSLTSAVSAAPASCRLVVDPSGDDRLANNPAPPPADTPTRNSDLDILSADVATDTKWVTAVIRLRTLAAPESAGGRMWHQFFTAGEQRYLMAAAVGPEGHDATVYAMEGEYEEGGSGAMYGTGIGGAHVTFDTAKKEVRMSAPLSIFAAHTPVTKGRVLHQLMTWSFVFAGVGGQRVQLPNDLVFDYGHGGAGTSVDSAHSKRTYTAGAKSCVTPGR